MFGRFAGLVNLSSSCSGSSRGASSAMGDRPPHVGSEWRGAQQAGTLVALAARRVQHHPTRPRPG
eukprot:5732833-Alexandrium_andersonii.AAC.1